MDHLFGNIASNGPPCGFSQQSVEDGVGKRRNGDGASELDGRSPCGASSVPSSWHGTAWTGFLPEQRGFTLQMLITSLCYQSEEQNWWFPVGRERCLLRNVAKTQEKREGFSKLWKVNNETSVLTVWPHSDQVLAGGDLFFQCPGKHGYKRCMSTVAGWSGKVW